MVLQPTRAREGVTRRSCLTSNPLCALLISSRQLCCSQRSYRRHGRRRPRVRGKCGSAVTCSRTMAANSLRSARRCSGRRGRTSTTVRVSTPIEAARRSPRRLHPGPGSGRTPAVLGRARSRLAVARLQGGHRRTDRLRLRPLRPSRGVDHLRRRRSDGSGSGGSGASGRCLSRDDARAEHKIMHLEVANESWQNGFGGPEGIEADPRDRRLHGVAHRHPPGDQRFAGSTCSDHQALYKDVPSRS